MVYGARVERPEQPKAGNDWRRWVGRGGPNCPHPKPGNPWRRGGCVEGEKWTIGGRAQGRWGGGEMTGKYRTWVRQERAC
jgi:hypothetical protein